MTRILITGGAGFIGSHLADELIEAGYHVRALDSLEPQVHGPEPKRPAYLHSDVELMVGDIRDRHTLRRALEGVRCVVHLAAAAGAGQSMYELARYVSVNTVGTALLLEEIVTQPVERLVVASSMSIYGEGSYLDAHGRRWDDAYRRKPDLDRGQWECLDEVGRPLRPVPTSEEKRPVLTTIYAQTKFDQERICLIAGEAYGIPTTALRLFNVYGARQALSNPYTGVLATFGSRILHGKRPLVFEDGLQLRDFVHVSDVARAVRVTLECDGAAGKALNIGGGRPYTILEIARMVASAMGRPELKAEVTKTSRSGDVRHCFADIALAQQTLGYVPTMPLHRGLQELCAWIRREQEPDAVDAAYAELIQRGLTR